ncbi:NAD(P)/FAD-dependent oxidoreductase [Brevibacillus ruminantium]|uniref:NAD(P)/FAD-dependent oxidoreductase n=1 Tax=Brevibacillus ruminantium TaxID=2950604 RepID=A0ABY4W945_9BACL|nr:NAD(P)/FAD-dependent oxidoreductase [Brevibacillus ruminantium]USG63547.1 NAD(P)/FAD-dependent oxidoreductase [Brevibacillus ruminantium]
MTFDTVIIGGGIAGWQAAIQLCRSLRRVAVIDAGGGRSSASRGYRNLLGFPAGVSGEQLRHAGRSYATNLGAVFVQDEVISLAQTPDRLFHLTTRSQRILQGQTIVLATGIDDPFPQIEGLRECLGISVFICPDCDGYEAVGKRTAVIGKEAQVAEMAKAISYYTDQLVLLHDKSTEHQKQIARILHIDGKVAGVELESGEKIEVERIFLAYPGARVQSQLLRSLSVQLNEKGHVLVDPRTKETSHPGIWAIGDVTVHSQQVAIAMGDGLQAAIWIHKRLQEQSRMHQETCTAKEHT